MTYSCAIFENLDTDIKKCSVEISKESPPTLYVESGDTPSPPPPPYCSWPPLSKEAKDSKDDLQTAQLRKLKHILCKADVRQHHKILEIGSGWGSFAILAVQLTGCTVDTITLSSQQQDFTRQRIAELGLEDKIQVHLMDYRNLPAEWEGRFDRIVSIEMLEAVGKEYLATYFKVVDWALKPAEGVAVIQSITIPEARE